MKKNKVQVPFVFSCRLNLVELTGLKATTIPELLEHIRTVNSSCIYQHTHHFIQRHQYLSPAPSNDFAYWVTESIGDKRLGEKLSSIDIMLHPTIKLIRGALIQTIIEALEERPRLTEIVAPEGEEFNFLKSISFIFPTDKAYTLKEFRKYLKKAGINSIYFHMFESRLKLEKTTNDFSDWILKELKEEELANKISQLDPYSQTGESLRKSIIKLIDQQLG